MFKKTVLNLSMAASMMVVGTGYTFPQGNPQWADDNIVVSDQTYSRHLNGTPVHEVRKAVEEFNDQQDSFNLEYTTAPCDQVKGICWTIDESRTTNWYVGLATFDATDWSADGQMYYCHIDMNSTYESSVHVIMHEMFHCFGYRNSGGTDDRWHSTDPDSIISVANNGNTELSENDKRFLKAVMPAQSTN